MAAQQEKEDVCNDENDKNIENDLVNCMEKVNLKDDNNKQRLKERDQVKIAEWLIGFESTFYWHTQQKRGLGVDQVILRTLEKLDELKIEEPEFSLQRFVSLLKLVVEYFIIGDMDSAREIMCTAEELLESESSQKDTFYQSVKFSLGHVVYVTKAQLLALNGEEGNSRKIGKNIIPVKVMSNSNQAAMYAMKARYFLYSGYENGETVGVECARKALELEPENGEWEYLLAKMLRQQRKEIPFSLEIPKEELLLLEKAVERSKSTKFLVYLAQVYRECGTQAFKQYSSRPDFFNSDLHETIKNMSIKALNYYKEALELNSDSPATLRRVGYGIMNLPKKVADYDLALKCLLRSAELSETMTTLHILGTFYHRYGNDNKKALEYFERTAKGKSHAGLSDMIRLKYLMDPTYDPCEDLNHGLEWEMKNKYRMQLMVQLGGYFLFIKRNFYKCTDYFSQVIAEDKDTLHMTKFKSFFLRMYDTIDLYHYLVNEALLLLQQKSDSTDQLDSSVSDEEIDHQINLGYVEDVIEKICDFRPELMEIIPDPSLIDKLHKTSKEIIEREKHKSYRNDWHGSQHNKSRSHNDEGSRPNQWNRGGRGQRNAFRGRGDRNVSSEDDCQRRGRFSVANQRDRDLPDNTERRGRFSVANQRTRNENNDSNWRQRGGGKQTQRDSENNWRKK